MNTKKFAPLFLIALAITLAACAPTAKEVAAELATLQAAAPATSPAPAATSAPGINAEGFAGPTTAEAKLAIALDVQRLKTEPSAFVWRSIPNAVSAICPKNWKCTLHLASGEIKLFVGDGTTYSIVAGTWRYEDAYDPNDAVHQNPPCQLLAKEQDFGAKEVPSFPVSAGNFSCPTSSAAVTTTLRPAPTVALASCPTFGGVATTQGNDGGPYCKYDGAVVTDVVPAGYKAEYWDGNAVQYAAADATITTSTATFRRP